jgi:hypothetical protein
MDCCLEDYTNAHLSFLTFITWTRSLYFIVLWLWIPVLWVLLRHVSLRIWIACKADIPFCNYSLSKTFFKVSHQEIITEMVTSSSLEFHFQHTVGTKIIEDIVVLIRLLCHKLAPSRYRVFSRMPWTKNINEIIYIFSSCLFNYAKSIKTI